MNKALENRLNEPQKMLLKQYPDLYKSLYVRVAQKQAPPRLAIKAKCLECVGWMRKEITECSAIDCPLWAYRPYQTKS